MEPPKPAAVRALRTLSRAPDAAATFDEYERLLAERFAQDPDAVAAPQAIGVPSREERLKELHDRLFPPGTQGSQP